MRAWPMDTPFNMADLSMQPPASFPELYQELWLYSGSYASSTSNAGNNVLQKGSTGTAVATTSQTKLITFSANWPASVKTALELALWTSSASYTAYAQLWDFTANAAVSGSGVSTTSTTATVLRSGQITLTPGHVYGVALYVTSGGTAYATDASLIIFPPAGSVSPSLSSISLANPSGGSLKEAYIPLWVYSSGVASTASTSQYYLQKGTNNYSSVNTGSATHLHSLNSGWSYSQKFAFEASLYMVNSGYTAYAALYDITAGSVVSASQVSNTTQSATVVRSGSFTLTPGHTYGVVFWSSSASGTTDITKCHLVALA